MPLHAFLNLPFKGAAQQKGPGREGMTPVVAFNHHSEPGVEQTFVIRKKIDGTTPKFRDFLDSKAPLTPWTLHLWHIPRSGPESNYISIELAGAKVAWISSTMPDLTNPANELIHEYEDVAFTFEKLTYTGAGLDK